MELTRIMCSSSVEWYRKRKNLGPRKDRQAMLYENVPRCDDGKEESVSEMVETSPHRPS